MAIPLRKVRSFHRPHSAPPMDDFTGSLLGCPAGRRRRSEGLQRPPVRSQGALAVEDDRKVDHEVMDPLLRADHMFTRSRDLYDLTNRALPSDRLSRTATGYPARVPVIVKTSTVSSGSRRCWSCGCTSGATENHCTESAIPTTAVPPTTRTNGESCTVAVSLTEMSSADGNIQLHR